MYFGVLECHHSLVSAGELKLGTRLSTISKAFIKLANALHTLRACKVFFDRKNFLTIMLVLKTLKEKATHLDSVPVL